MKVTKDYLAYLPERIERLQDQLRTANAADRSALVEELDGAQRTLVSDTKRYEEMVKTWPDFKAENEASGAYWQSSLDKLNARAAAEGLI
ncbi:MAG: hypothetical protein P8X43_10965 [Maritimibacter sp.]|jgi:hypothetical protein